jgi:hypothetical protein
MGSEEAELTQPSKNGHKKRRSSRPTKATPARIKAILRDLALGLTREQACAANGCSVDAFQAWEKRPEFHDLRAKAQAARIKYLLKAKDQAIKNKLDWKGIAWDLEKAFRSQYGDPSPSAGINVQQNTYTISVEQSRQLEERHAKLLPEIHQMLGIGNGENK